MKNKLPKIFACTLAATLLCVSAAGCGPTPGGGGAGTEKIDNTKTQLYVYNFYGGYGSDWLAEAKKRYEDLHKDDVWEDGKKGVQIYINNKKEQISSVSNQILDNRDEIYFTEYAYYYTLKAEGVLGDITEAVTGSLSAFGEDKTIESKLTQEQKNYYGVAEADGTHYYGLPHYSGYNGLVYNVDLFDEEGFYFAEEPSDSTLEGKFIDKFNTVRSAGPDGVKGTYDDGLPTTYEEFFWLCDYIKGGGATPVAWNGFDYTHYLQRLAQALQTDYEGMEQTMLNFTLTGEANTLATVSGGNVSIGSPVTVSDDDAYQLGKQAGKYYALSFLEKLVKTDGYHNRLAFNTAYSHMNAQEDFLQAGNDGKTAPIAMLCEGIWWEMEAKDVFNRMEASKGEQFSKYGRNFGFMPLPKATAAKAEEAKNAPANEKNTLVDTIFSLCFMKANVAEWKKPLALDFIKFVNTDESLREFTKVTNTVKSLNYTMTDEDMEGMTAFGKSVVQLKATSKVVYPFSTNSTYVNNQSFFQDYFSSKISGTSYSFAAQAFHDKSTITAEDYFKGLETYYRDNWVK